MYSVNYIYHDTYVGGEEFAGEALRAADVKRYIRVVKR